MASEGGPEESGKKPADRKLPRLPDPPRTDPLPTTTAEQQPPRTGRKRRWPTVLLVVGIVMAVLIGGLAAGSFYLYNRFNGNIEELADVQVDTREENDPINVLLMGSDTRAGKGNGAYGSDAGRGGQRSDTTILLHISGDRTRALAVSIPRDTWVRQPECADPNRNYFKFNNAFDQGGPKCTTELVQQLTGVPIHHVVVVDFNGFKNLVDALGGVEVCLSQPVNDQDSKLNLPAGTQRVFGEDALAFVRARKTLGDGSDIGRIKRQQAFLSAAIRQVTDKGLLLNPVQLFQVLEAATKALKVDKSLKEVSGMKDMAESMNGIDPSDITFVTMPFLWRDDGANVEIDQPKAQQIWNAIKEDTPWPPPVSVGPDGQKLIMAPSDIYVNVVNNSGDETLTARAQTQLRMAGFNINQVTTGDRVTNTTKVQYPADLEDSARTVAYATDATMKQQQEGWAVTLIIGRDWNGVEDSIVVRKPKKSNDGGTATEETTSAADTVCA